MKTALARDVKTCCFRFLSIAHYLPLKSAAYGGEEIKMHGRNLGSGVLRRSWRDPTLACAQSRKHCFVVTNLGLLRLKIKYRKRLSETKSYLQ